MAIMLTVKVVPRSSRKGAVLEEGGVIKVFLSAAPERGKANQALLRFIADTLNIPLRNCAIVSGMTTPRKVISIVTKKTAEMIISELCGSTDG